MGILDGAARVIRAALTAAAALGVLYVVGAATRHGATGWDAVSAGITGVLHGAGVILHDVLGL